MRAVEFSSFLLKIMLFVMSGFLCSMSYGSKECSKYLSTTKIKGLELVKFSDPAKRPAIGNRINPEKLQKWVEAHRQMGDKYYTLAKFLAKYIKIFTQAEFESMLMSSTEAFLRSIPNKEYSIVVNEGKMKSQFWVAKIINELSSRKPTEVLIDPSTKALGAYMKRYPNREILFIDDATYTFESIESGLNTTFSLFKDTGSYRVNDWPRVNVVVAAHTTYVETIIESKNINLFSTHHMPSVAELLKEVDDPILRMKLQSAFEDSYGEFALDLVLTGFAHKTADMASVVGMSSEETYVHLKKHPKVISGEKSIYNSFGTTVLEGVIMAPDNMVFDTVEILDAEVKPY